MSCGFHCLFKGQALDFSYPGSDERQVGAVVPGTPQRGGRHVWGVCLQHYEIQRNLLYGVGQGCFLESDYPAYAHGPPAVFLEPAPSLHAAAECVQAAFFRECAATVKHSEEVLRGLAQVDVHGESTLRGPLQLPFQGIPICFLNFGWGDDISHDTGKQSGLVSWTHRKDPNGYTKRDNWLRAVVSSFDVIQKVYKTEFNYECNID